MIISNENDIIRYRNVAGIYRFRNKLNDKSYVGQSLTIGKRIREHLCALRNKRRLYTVHKAILKYGIENFEIEILTTFERLTNIRELLNLAEMVYIRYYNSFENGYNETLGGDSMLGRKWSDSQRLRMREVMTGRKRQEDYVDPRSRRVYLFNYRTGLYSEASSPKAVVRNIDSAISLKQIYACVTGRHISTGDYICAYSKEELEDKIKLFNNKKHANKSKKTF